MERIDDRPFYRKFFQLTGTIALQNLVVFSVSLADNIMLGTYQESALSGVALVNQIQFLLQMLTMGLEKVLSFLLPNIGEKEMPEASKGL